MQVVFWIFLVSLFQSSADIQVNQIIHHGRMLASQGQKKEACMFLQEQETVCFQNFSRNEIRRFRAQLLSSDGDTLQESMELYQVLINRCPSILSPKEFHFFRIKQTRVEKLESKQSSFSLLLDPVM